MFKIILFLLFLFLPLSGCYSQQQVKADNLKEEAPYAWDFGRVKEGTLLVHAFILKNESKKAIKIEDTQTSCGCTVSSVTKKALLPGESASLEVRFNTKDYSGVVQQYVYVHTDNLDNPIIKYIIKADVVK
ncbi:MAG: DUF1573 domain-containing protein [Candidatus Omnitrophica bacterium]|nr:DUF1573 domain-containing protein [Candidatus Omnitrophota bacterium]